MELNDRDLVQKLKENNQQLILPLATKKKILKQVELQGKKSVVEEMQQELSRLREETEFLKNQSEKLSSFGKVAASLDWDLNLGIKIICFRNGWFSTGFFVDSDRSYAFLFL
ncbi:hypothetical protein BpHYR1_017534 [Brachionus plicatilis]|uniref:Uncharacterized protein n=1 Tax=Brachionus plicatilis TaxID=10195 RepID=A0A3M7PGF2_BRAPC|nr:hypothetical protein BpHYR1_017534 [Brachionus plicatilis]